MRGLRLTRVRFVPLAMENSPRGAQLVPFRKGQTAKFLKRVAPQVGLEPTTLRLTAGCSAN